jgi:hypothetical protein
MYISFWALSPYKPVFKGGFYLRFVSFGLKANDGFITFQFWTEAWTFGGKVGFNNAWDERVVYCHELTFWSADAGATNNAISTPITTKNANQF